MKFRMSIQGRFGQARRARLNRELVEAVVASQTACEACHEIHKDLDATADGAEFVESLSFPGNTVHKLDAHFKSHWKAEYEVVEASLGKPQ
jgi:hypothetical protein